MALDTQTRPPLTDTVQQNGATPMAAVLALQVQTMSAAGSMLAEKDIVYADATAAPFTITLPSAPYIGKPYSVKEISGANLVTVDAAGAGTIDGAANVSVPAGEGVTVVARSISATTGLVTWSITSQTAPNPGAGGTLLAANNLSDVSNAATSRTNLGVPATATVLAVANNLSDLANAATARTNLGVPSTAQALLVANDLGDVNDAALSRANISANRKTVTFTRVDLVAATAAVYRYVNNSGFAETILSLASAITGALAVGDATITASIDGVPVTTGVITITQAASAAGDVDSTIPTALNVIGLGSKLELTVGGANTATVFADVSVAVSY